MSPEHPRRTWARRTESVLTWVGYTADAAAGIAYLDGSAQWCAIAKVVGTTAKAGSWAAHRWATRHDRPEPDGR